MLVRLLKVALFEANGEHTPPFLARQLISHMMNKVHHKMITKFHFNKRPVCRYQDLSPQPSNVRLHLSNQLHFPQCPALLDT